MGYTKPSYVTIPFGKAPLTPWVVSTTYLFGDFGIPAVTTTTRHKIIFPLKGVVRGVYFKQYCVTAAGSNEAWPMVFRLNDTTDTAIDSQSTVGPERIWSNYTLNIPVVVGDFFEIKSVTPNWGTPPSDGGAMEGYGIVVVEVA